MSVFVHTTPAPATKTANITSVGRIYALILVFFAVSQLCSFNNFLGLIQTFLLPGGTVFAYTLGAALVFAELMAIPFLLRLRLSPLMRAASMVMGWIVAILWISITIWLNASGNPTTNVGFLGTLVLLLPGWWAVFISIGLAILAVWASWGMWPTWTVSVRSHKK